MLRVSAYSSRELLMVLRGLRNLDKDTRRHTRRGLTSMARDAWQQAVTARATRKVERLVLADTARVRVSDQNVRLTSATVGRALRGGLKPSLDWHPVEFGSGPQSPQFKAPNRRGYVVYPAIAEMAPRILAMYVQTFVRAINEALEGRSQ